MDVWGYPSNGAERPELPPFGQPIEPTRRRLLPALRAMFAVIVGLAVVGVPAGVVWNAVAPHAEGEIVEEGVDLVDPATKAFIGADAVFMIVMAVVGVMAGVVAWRLGRRYGPAVSIGLALGGLAASYVAWKVGWGLTHGAVLHWADTAPVGARRALFVDLGAKGALCAGPLAAVLTHLALTGLVDKPTH
jgi:hypothetical protein